MTHRPTDPPAPAPGGADAASASPSSAPRGRVPWNVEGTALARLQDRLNSALIHMSPEGEVVWTNLLGRALLEGPAAPLVRQSLQGGAERLRTSADVVDRSVNLGPTGELRQLQARGTDGILAVLERGDTRLRAEVRVLRAMLASAVEAAPPLELARQALEQLAASVPGLQLLLFSADAAAGIVRPVAQAGMLPGGEVRVVERILDSRSSAVGRAAVLGTPVHLTVLARSPFADDARMAHADTLQLLALPVRARGKPVGALELCGGAQVLGESELRLVQGLADMLGALLERSRADAALDEERAARRALMDNMPDAVVEQGPDGRITLAAGRVEPILGRRAEGLAGTPLADTLHPQDQEAFEQLVSTAAEAGSGVSAARVRVVRPRDGSVATCETTVSVSHGPSGRTVRAVFRDITERLALEADVRRARDQALQQERLAAMGRLAAGVAHEVNNPLAYVKANVGAIPQQLDWLEKLMAQSKPIDAPVRELRAIATESLDGIDRISHIVKALKGITRNKPNEWVQFDPLKAVQDAITIYRGVNKSGCQVSCASSTMPRVWGAPGALGQILLNLIQNASDAMGGRGNVVIDAVVEHPKLRIRVADEGTGIPVDVQGQLFEPFFTTKDVGAGTGLGLYICRQLISQMQGEIWFDTGPQGTTFHITLPIEPPTFQDA